MVTTTLKTLRQKVAKKIYAARFPIVSTTTSDSDSLTLVIDTLLSPAAQIEDFIEAWIFVAEQPTKIDSGKNINEGGEYSATDTTLTMEASHGIIVGDGIQIESEILRVTAVDTNDLTVVRGIQSTIAATHADGTDVYIIGPAVGEVARVTDVGFSGSNSQLTVAPGFTASLVSGTDYEVHYKFYPVHIRDKINEILENVRRPIYLPLTLVTDGDMESTGTSDWTAAASTGTAPALAKGTTNVLHGRRSLTITASSDATNSFAKSASMFLSPSTAVFVSADVFITGGDKAKLTLYDVTNSAEIETAESVTTGWVHLRFIDTIPSNCEEIQVWLESPVASDVTYWNSVQLLPVDLQVYDFPSTLEWGEDFRSVFYWPTGTGLSGTGEDNSFRTFGQVKKAWSPAGIVRDETAVVPFRIELKRGNINEALYVGGAIDFSTLSDDTDTTNAPEDIIVNLTYADLMDAWAQEDIADDKFQAAQVKMSKANNIRRLLGPRMRQFWAPQGRITGTRGR